MLKKLYVLIAFCLITANSFAQEDYALLEQKFNDFAKIKPTINEVVKIDVSGLSLYDLIMAIAEEHQLNVSVDNSLNIPVVNNFHDVTVRDAFLFLTQKYDLEVRFMSNILTFNKRKEVKIIVKNEPKIVDVTYNPQMIFFLLNCKMIHYHR